MDQQLASFASTDVMHAPPAHRDQPLTHALVSVQSGATARLRQSARRGIIDEHRLLHAHVADPAIRLSAVFDTLAARAKVFADRLAGLLPRLERAREDFSAGRTLEADDHASNQLLNALDGDPLTGSDASRELLRRTVNRMADVGGAEATLLAASDHVYLDRLQSLRREYDRAGARRFGWKLASHLVRIAWGFGMILLAVTPAFAGWVLPTVLVATYFVLELLVQPALRSLMNADDRQRLPVHLDRFYREALLTQRSMDLADDFIDEVRDRA